MDRWVASAWKLPVLAGLILGSSYYLPLLIPNLVAFVPLLYWLDRHPRASLYGRLRAGFLLGFVTHLITLHFHYAMLRFSWLAALLYVGFAFLLAVRISLGIALVAWLRERTRLSWAILLPVTWVPLEWLATFGDTRMTGDHLALTMSRFPFVIQFADLVGHYGVSLFVVVVNGLVYESWIVREKTNARNALAALVMLGVLVLGYDAWTWFRPLPDAGTLKVALVQPNISQEAKLSPDTETAQWETLVRLTRQAAQHEPDLIIWPETARPWPFYHWLERPDSRGMLEVEELAKSTDTPILSGVEYYRVRSREDYEFYNAAMLVHEDGTLDEAWGGKVYLVPFTEALPFRALFGRLIGDRGGEWGWITGSFTPAPESALLPVGDVRAGVLVCYEQLFPDLSRMLRRRGADFQVIITNDAWFGRTVFQGYQADAPRLRAIENRSEFLRVANTGISGRVDRRGRYHQRSALFEEDVQIHQLRLAGPPTVYARLGDMPVWFALAGLLWALVVARSRPR